MEKELIEKAWNTSRNNWYEILQLIEQAGDIKTKESLRMIMNYKYHLEGGYHG